MPLFLSLRSRGFSDGSSLRSFCRTALLGLGILMAPLMSAPADSAPADGAPPELLQAPAADASPPAARVATGWRVFLDPVTGEIVSRPSGEQVRRFQQSIEELEIGEPVPDFHPFYLYNGGTGVYVGDRFMTSTVVRRADDGSLVIDCATDPDHLHHHHPPLAPRTSAHPETARRPDAPVM